MKYKINNKTLDKLKYDLVREGLLDYNQLIEAVDLSRSQQASLGEILIQNNIIREETLLNYLEQKLHIPYVNLEDYSLDLQIAHMITYEEAKKHKLIPLFVIEDTITIAMADPLDLFTLNNLSLSQNYKLEPVICSETSILKTIEEIFNTDQTKPASGSLPAGRPSGITATTFNWQTELSEDSSSDINMYRLVKAIVYQALSENATEVHIEPWQDLVSVRFRIDNILFNRGSFPILLISGLSARIKSAAGLNTEQEGIPQQGKMQMTFEKDTVNTSISVYPTDFGERIVVKILYKAPSLKNLGLDPHQLETLMCSLRQKRGLILAAASSDHAEIQTFYAILEYLNNEHTSIITVENLIRYNIYGINQTRASLMLKFPEGDKLSAILAQEPDILYIEQTSDRQILESITRHSTGNKLFMTSVPAYNAANALFYLLNTGISRHLLASSINMVFAQKFIRTLCPECKTTVKYSKDELARYRLEESDLCYRAKGCSYCNNTGYKGQTALFEMIVLDNDNRNCLMRNKTEFEFLEFLQKNKYQSFYDIAIMKVKTGVTSIDEIKGLYNS